MKKIATILFAAIIGVGFMSTSAFADAAKGQKLIIKFLKKPCGFNGAVMAAKHSQSEWQTINDEGKLADEIQKICPKAKPVKEKFLPHIYDFLYNYASDSGNVPSC